MRGPKHVRNNSGATDTWVGQKLDNLEVFEIEAINDDKWLQDTKVLTDLATGDLQFSTDGTTWTLQPYVMLSNFLNSVDDVNEILTCQDGTVLTAGGWVLTGDIY